MKRLPLVDSGEMLFGLSVESFMAGVTGIVARMAASYERLDENVRRKNLT